MLLYWSLFQQRAKAERTVQYYTVRHGRVGKELKEDMSVFWLDIERNVLDAVKEGQVELLTVQSRAHKNRIH